MVDIIMRSRYAQGDYMQLRMMIGSYKDEIRTFPYDIGIALLKVGHAEEVELTKPDPPDEDVGFTEPPPLPDDTLSPVTGEPDDIVTPSKPPPKPKRVRKKKKK